MANATIETKLSVEVQLLVIDHLRPIDMIHLELTSKHFRDLILAHGEMVWRGCLKRLCDSSELFWPSFKDLTGVAELKRACTGSLDLKRKISLWEASSNKGLTMPVRTIALRFPPLDKGPSEAESQEEEDGDEEEEEEEEVEVEEEEEEDSEEEETDTRDIRNFYLVPGGRLLVTIESNGIVSLWDIGKSSEKKEDSPTLLVRHQLPEFDYMANATVANGTTVYILTLDSTNQIPPMYTQSDDATEVWATTCTITAVVYDEVEETFAMHQVGTLTVISLDIAYAHINSLGRVVLQSEDDKNIIWNFLEDSFTIWNHADNPEIWGEPVSTDTSIILVARGKFHCFDLPAFLPVPENRYLDVLKADIAFLAPTLVLSDSEGVSPALAAENPMMLCGVSTTTLEVGRPVFYNYSVLIDERKPLVTHRYCLSLKESDNQDSFPVPTLTTLEVYQPSMVSIRARVWWNVHTLQVFDGDLWSLWGSRRYGADCCTTYASISWSHPFEGSQDTPKRLVSEEPKDLDPARFMHGKPWVTNRGCQFDPSSQQAGALLGRTRPRSVSWIELYKF